MWILLLCNYICYSCIWFWFLFSWNTSIYFPTFNSSMFLDPVNGKHWLQCWYAFICLQSWILMHEVCIFLYLYDLFVHLFKCINLNVIITDKWNVILISVPDNWLFCKWFNQVFYQPVTFYSHFAKHTAPEQRRT